MLKRYIVKRYKYNPYAVPFYVEDLSGQGGTLTFDTQYSDATNIEYSTDAKHWSSTKPGIPANGKLYMRANATHWGTYRQNGAHLASSNNFAVGGNIMSLLYGSSFTGNERVFPTNTSRTFSGMFMGTTKLIDASNLLLPATTLANYCYEWMFREDTNLLTPPTTLPATTLTEGCYGWMFSCCENLTTTLELPSAIQTVDANSYIYMYEHCFKITTAFVPGTPNSSQAMEGMFADDRMLSSVTVTATNWIAQSYWMRGVAATGTFTKPSGTSIPVGSNGIPNANWTVINQ